MPARLFAVRCVFVLSLVIPTSHRYGFAALFEELQQQGISIQDIEQHTGLCLDEQNLNVQQRLLLFNAARNLSAKSETGLLAGSRQQVSNYGAYGYAMATSSTLADAFSVASTFFALSGAVFRITLDIEDGEGVFRSHQPDSLGVVLPFVAEYWRASQSTLFSLVLGQQFPSTSMKFPYPKPRHAGLYRQVFRCPVEFGGSEMEWRFDASILTAPCVQADKETAKLCEQYCEHFVGKSGATQFQRDVLSVCITSLPTGNVDATSVAEALAMSRRSLYRRLSDEGITYKELVDQLRHSVATEYLANTTISVEDIAARCGYQDVSNFRKAFRRWAGKTPSVFRSSSG